MQDWKPYLTLASPEDTLRYEASGSYGPLPEAILELEKHPLAARERGDKKNGLLSRQISISSTHKHLARWMGQHANGMWYPIGHVMVILNAAPILYPEAVVNKSLTTEPGVNL